jgi:hypothetical protein
MTAPTRKDRHFARSWGDDATPAFTQASEGQGKYAFQPLTPARLYALVRSTMRAARTAMLLDDTNE